VANFVVDHRNDFALFDTLYSGHMDSSSIEELDEFLEEMTPYENRWGKTRFAPMFSLSLHNFGFGVFNTTDIWIKADRGIYNPRVYGQAISNLVFLTGYAQPIRHNVTVGLTGKYISRRRSGLVKIAASDLDGTNEVLMPAYDQLKTEDKGCGLDLGVLYTHRPHLNFGFVLHDAVGWIGSEHVRRNLKAGVAYQWQAFISGKRFLFFLSRKALLPPTLKICSFLQGTLFSSGSISERPRPFWSLDSGPVSIRDTRRSVSDSIS
jgi:hypothetical protein